MLKTIKYLFIFFIGYSNAQNKISIEQKIQAFDSVININYSQAKYIARQALLESEALQDTSLVLQSSLRLSKLYWYLQIPDSSLVYCDKALFYAKASNAIKEEAILYNIRGNIFRLKNDFKTALECHEKSLNLAIMHSLDRQEAEVYKSIALLYRSKKDEVASLKAIKRAITLFSKMKDLRGLAESYNVKGLLLFHTKIDSSLFYFEKALKNTVIANDVPLQGLVRFNIGDLYLNKKKKYNLAALNFKKADSIGDLVGDFKSRFYANVSKGIYYEEIEQFEKAASVFIKVLRDYKTIMTGKNRRDLYWLLSEALWYDQKYKEAFDYQERYIYLNDSIFNLEKEKEFANLKTQYEVEKKDNEIALLAKENELEKNQKKWIIISALLLTLPLIGLFLFYRHRAKTQKTIREQEQQLYEQEKTQLQQERQLKETQALIRGQDKERERIAKELHDGIGGQLAGINLSLSQINQDINSTAITIVNTTIKHTFKELRALSHDLSYKYHIDTPFTSLLEALKQKYKQSNSFHLEVSVYPENALDQISINTKHNLYRIIQELLTNVTKHAKAQNVELSFSKHEDATMVVMLSDDGVGYNSDKTAKGIGLKNIKERVISIKGALTVDTAPGKGTSTIIELPIQLTHEN